MYLLYNAIRQWVVGGTGTVRYLRAAMLLQVPSYFPVVSTCTVVHFTAHMLQYAALQWHCESLRPHSGRLVWKGSIYAREQNASFLPVVRTEPTVNASCCFFRLGKLHTCDKTFDFVTITDGRNKGRQKPFDSLAWITWPDSVGTRTIQWFIRNNRARERRTVQVPVQYLVLTCVALKIRATAVSPRKLYIAWCNFWLLWSRIFEARPNDAGIRFAVVVVLVSSKGWTNEIFHFHLQRFEEATVSTVRPFLYYR